ncbi:unnamed protein product, partial [Mesorhabditis belari]|uniref:GH18 domain-containing protein n=1 Tax=Mesorhabditis belari TaxID=2138241 RepID=A0AAF3EA15_9BILA
MNSPEDDARDLPELACIWNGPEIGINPTTSDGSCSNVPSIVGAVNSNAPLQQQSCYNDYYGHSLPNGVQTAENPNAPLQQQNYYYGHVLPHALQTAHFSQQQWMQAPPIFYQSEASTSSDGFCSNVPPIEVVNPNAPLQQQSYHYKHGLPTGLQTAHFSQQQPIRSTVGAVNPNAPLQQQSCYNDYYGHSLPNGVQTAHFSQQQPMRSIVEAVIPATPPQQQSYHYGHSLPNRFQTDQSSQRQWIQAPPIIYQSEDQFYQQHNGNLNSADQVEVDNFTAAAERLTLPQLNHLADAVNKLRDDKIKREQNILFKTQVPSNLTVSEHEGEWIKPRIDPKPKHDAKAIVVNPTAIGTCEYAKLYGKFTPVFEVQNSITAFESLDTTNIDAFYDTDEFKAVMEKIENDEYKDEYMKYESRLMQFIIYIWAWMPLFCKLKEIFIEKGKQENEFPCYQYRGLNYWNGKYSAKVKGPNMKREAARRKIEERVSPVEQKGFRGTQNESHQHRRQQAIPKKKGRQNKGTRKERPGRYNAGRGKHSFFMYSLTSRKESTASSFQGDEESNAPKRLDSAAYIRPCYFTNWAQYRKGRAKFLTSDYKPGLCTHIIYAFAYIDKTDFSIKITDPTDLKGDNGGPGQYELVNNLKKIQPDLKTLLSIGGWSFGTKIFKEMSANPSNRAAFINAALRWARLYNFDGIDLDWEYPKKKDPNYVALLQEMRISITAEARLSQKTPLLFTAAVAAGADEMKGYDIPNIASSLDFVNVITYDFWTPDDDEGITGMNSPLYNRSDLQKPERLGCKGMEQRRISQRESCDRNCSIRPRMDFKGSK